MRGVGQRYAALDIAPDHLRRRMPESVAVAGLDQGDARLHGVEQQIARRGLASMVRHEEQVGAQIGRPSDQRGLLQTLDVTGQDGRCPAIGDAKNARDRIGLGEGPIVGRGRLSTSKATPSQVQRWPASQRRAVRSA